MENEAESDERSVVLPLEQVRDTIRDGRWTFAKSMPEIPHEYVVKGKTLAAEPFLAFVKHIRAAGVRKHWRHGRYFVYFEVDGYEYWTMGAPAEETTIINRARVK